jgi:hypothetical protein
VINRIVFSLIVFFSVFSVSTQISYAHYLEIPIQVLCPIIIFFYITRVNFKDYLVLIFFTNILLSALYCDNLLAGLRYLSYGLLGYFVMPKLVKDDDSIFRAKFNIFLITVLPLIAVITVNILYQKVPYEAHALPFTGSCLTAGYILSVLACILFFCGYTITHYAVSLLCIVFILILNARAPIYGLVIYFIIGMFQMGHQFISKHIKYVVLLCALILATNLAFKDLYESIYRRYVQTSIMNDESVEGRLISWRIYLKRTLNYPFGLGFDKSYFEFYNGREQNNEQLITSTQIVTGAHCEFIKILLEIGWFGCLVFILINVRAFKHALAALASKRSSGMLKAMGAAYIVVLPQIIVNNELQQPEVGIIYWFILGYLRTYGSSAVKTPVPAGSTLE